MRILLLSSDESERREHNAAFLAKYGDVTRARSAREAVDLLLSHHNSCVDSFSSSPFLISDRTSTMARANAASSGSDGSGLPLFHCVIAKLGKFVPRNISDQQGDKEKRKVRQNAQIDEEDDRATTVFRAVRTLMPHGRQVFCIALSYTACSKPGLRMRLFAQEQVNMVTAGHVDLRKVMEVLRDHWNEIFGYLSGSSSTSSGNDSGNTSRPATDDRHFLCPYCGLGPLSEDSLWKHAPMFHVHEKNPCVLCPICLWDRSGQRCPTCQRDCASMPLGVHLFNQHGPVGRGEHRGDDTAAPRLYAFALVVCRHPTDPNLFLCVQEFCGKGYWLPGGRVDAGETFQQAAVRETLEEAGVNVTLTGILGIQFRPRGNHARQRVIFLAVPTETEPPQQPKTLPDYESAGAAWVDGRTVTQLPLRGLEPAHWFKYVLDGGDVYSMNLLSGHEL